jgi:Ca2+-binding RTX toxin-like protein
MVTMEPPEYLEGLLARLISIENVTGTSDGDWIAGNGVANRLVGGAGFDIIEGGGGNDLLEGGLDNDRLSGGSGDDTLSGGAHDDRLLGGADSDYLVGGEGGDTLDGGLGDDILNGGSGFDYADYSAFASNTVRLADLGVQNVGQAGKDRLISVEGLVGGKGADVFVGDALGNVLDGGSGHDTLNGGDGNDTLFGRTGRDSLFGSTGLDSLGGGDGDDVIDGGAGTDVLAGDAGADRFVFRSAAEANDDVVFDFFGSQGDRLDLRLIDANSSAGGDQGFAFIGAAGFTGVAGQLRYQTTSSTPGTPVFVQGDTNGDAQADFQITVLPGVPYPVVSDFLL